MVFDEIVNKLLQEAIILEKSPRCTKVTGQQSSSRPGKKYMRCVKSESGGLKRVHYGDPKRRIKKSNPKKRKSFRARHKCGQKKKKTSAGYWSCKNW